MSTTFIDPSWIAFHHDVDPDVVADDLIRRDVERPRRNRDMTPMKLHKLMYLAQAQYLASTHERLFADRVEAYKHGPVVPSQRRRFHGRGVIPGSAAHSPQPPRDIKVFLDQVWTRYGHLSASELRNLSHTQDPWKNAYVEGQMHTLIADADMGRYFESEPAENRIFSDAVVVVPSDLFDSVDEDELVEEMAEALR